MYPGLNISRNSSNYWLPEHVSVTVQNLFSASMDFAFVFYQDLPYFTCVCTLCACSFATSVPGMCITAKRHVKICLLACCRKRKKSTSVQWWVDGGRRGKTWGTGVVGRQWMSSSFTSLCGSVNSQSLYLLDVKLLFSIGNETACGEVAFICLETYMGVYLMQFL